MNNSMKNMLNEYIEYLEKEIAIREGKIEPDKDFFDMEKYKDNIFIQNCNKERILSSKIIIEAVKKDLL